MTDETQHEAAEPLPKPPDQAVPVPGPDDDTNGILIVLWRAVDADDLPTPLADRAGAGYFVAGAYRVDDDKRAKRLAMSDPTIADRDLIDACTEPKKAGVHLQVVLARNWIREPQATRWVQAAPVLEIG